jgi:selenocysteine-specific translation elongation factor
VKQLVRGNTLAEPDSLFVTTRVRLAIELLRDRAAFTDRQRLRFLIGTDEVLGRIQIIHAENRICFANLLLEKPIAAAWGDRFIIRRYSPMETLGGGQVLEPDAPRYRAADRPSEIIVSRGLSTASLKVALKSFLTYRAKFGLSLQYIAQCFGIPVSRVLDAAEDLDTVITHDFMILSEHFDA